MKKTLPILALVLCLLGGLVSGTLALYQSNVDGLTGGNAIAKNFVFDAQDEKNNDGYSENILVAPSDTMERIFTATNTKDGVIAEVPMKLDATFTLANAEGKTAIPRLTAKLLKLVNGEYVEDATIAANINNGLGTITITDLRAFEPNVSSTNTYKLVVEWPVGEAGNHDEDYQGHNFGTKVTANMTATQIAENAVNQNPYEA